MRFLLKYWVPITLLMVTAGSMLKWFTYKPPPSVRTQIARTDVRNIRNALRAYHNDYDTYPSGDYAQICRSLFGDNRLKQKYFDIGPKGINEKGEIIDPWGTPYRIDFSPHPDAPRVQSAGKNRVFEPRSESSDDCYSWEE